MKIILSIKTILFCSCLVGCLMSCSKDESNDLDPNCSADATLFIPTELANFKFKVGTYWVFKDTVSNKIDTLRVDSITANGLYQRASCKNVYNEYYAFMVNEKIDTTKPARDFYLIDNNALKINPTAYNSFGIYYTNYPKKDSMFIYDRYYKGVVESSNQKTGNNVIFYINTTYGFLKRETYKNGLLISNKVLIDKQIIK